MGNAGAQRRSGWQLASLWTSGVAMSVVLSSAVVLSAAGRVTDPVTTFELASGDEGVTSAGDVLPATAQTTPDEPAWPDLSEFREQLAAGMLTSLEVPAPDAATGGDAPVTRTSSPTTDAPTAAASKDEDTSGKSKGKAKDEDKDKDTSGKDKNKSGKDGSEKDPSSTEGDDGETISTPAGTVRVEVKNDGVQLVYATPGKGYAVSVKGEDTEQVEVTLTSKSGTTRIAASLTGENPSLEVTVAESATTLDDARTKNPKKVKKSDEATATKSSTKDAKNAKADKAKRSKDTKKSKDKKDKDVKSKDGKSKDKKGKGKAKRKR